MRQQIPAAPVGWRPSQAPPSAGGPTSVLQGGAASLYAPSSSPPSRRRRRSDGESQRPLGRALADTPPWLISTLVHMAVLLIMASFMVGIDEPTVLELDVVLGEDAGVLLEDADALEDDARVQQAVAFDAPLVLEPLATAPELDLDMAGLAPLEPLDIAAQAIAVSLEGREEGSREQLLQMFGGNEASEAAVARGLLWLSRHQAPDGRWSLHAFDEECRNRNHRCTGTGLRHSDTAATGLALLCFLGAGHTHEDGRWSDVVSRGIDWLLAGQQADGSLFIGGGANELMYSHGIATIALCECYGMTHDSRLPGPCERALEFISNAQSPRSGGWRYRPLQGEDTSVLGWQLMALQSARMAALEVPEHVLQEASRYLDLASHQQGSRYAYVPGHPPDEVMTAEGLLCRQYLGWTSDNAALRSGVGYLMQNLPSLQRRNVYYWYYATQVLHHVGGEEWRRWNAAMRDLLVESQVPSGEMAGSWHPMSMRGSGSDDAWGRDGGRLYVTALSILTLEVYYRHLPLYQPVAIGVAP